MDNRDKVKKLIINFSGKDNVIPIPVIYIKLLGDYHTAAFLNQLVYWSDKTKRTDGYFYKTYKEWHEELRLSRYQIDKSISKLKELGLIETALKKANGAPTLHYKLNTDKLSTWICEKLTNGIDENSQMELRKTDKSLTETTTEITTETNNNSATKVTQEQFDQWWNLYDKKLDKKKAFSLFKSALKKHEFETIMNGTKNYLKTINDKQYQKYPKTFLSQESYMNDYQEETSNFNKKENNAEDFLEKKRQEIYGG